MPDKYPLVSVGIPVYNGENFLRFTLDSILGQTYKNLDIIIFDNASTDRTGEICKEYAENDARVRYNRNSQNFGAAWNYNLTLKHARGKYFKWAAHDDLCKETFIERCVDLLEREPTVALAYPKTIIIDDNGGIVDEHFEDHFNIRETQAHHRYRHFTKTPLDCNAVFGVVRTDILRKTPGIGPYESSDRVLLGELSLHGEIAEIPERLFLRRYHSNVSTFACTSKKTMAAWFDPTSSGRFTRLQRFVGYIQSLRRAPLSTFQRVYSCSFLLLFYKRTYLRASHWKRLTKRVNKKGIQSAAPRSQPIDLLQREKVF